MIRRVLVANRGEIAVRIVRACRALGLGAVAVYSDADVTAAHVALADTAVRLGPAAAAASYLDAGALVAAARATGCDALHPGYGFLSEQPALAEACAAAGVTFVGPSPEALRLLGDKGAARRIAVEAGFRLVPGGDDAEAVGFPLLVKAVAGGGGRGMRVVRARDELASAREAAAREASSAFGDGRVYLERYLEGARHVEVQALGDGAGGAATLGLRDCSLQRRHQKVLEEAPAPGVPAGIQEELQAAARRLLVATGYAGAATVELLLTPAGEAFFLEVNARLQVEHPVTELVTGEDVVAWQLRIAGGERLPPGGLEPAVDGHAVEARLVAEDADAGFLPSAGTILRLELPAGEGLRVDAGYAAGDEVTTYYDGLLAKICAHAPTREQALDRLAAALEATTVLGVRTNLPLLRHLAADADVRAGRIDTGFLERTWAPQPPADDAVAAALDAARAAEHGADPFAGGFRLGAATRPAPPAARAGDGALHVLVEGRDVRVAPAAPPDVDALAQAPASGASGAVVVTAVMPGRVAAVLVEPGARVAAGAALVVLEAMKMEQPAVAPYEATVREVHVAVGQPVSRGQLLVILE